MSELLDEYPMLLLVAEAGVALFILIFIIVWTMTGRKKWSSGLNAIFLA